MLYAYLRSGAQLQRMPVDADLSGADWVDLYRPLPAQVEAVGGLGVSVPTLPEMQEIEISNRLYRRDGVDYMTVVLPGLTPDGDRVAGPVTFILTRDRLITVRHHAPHPFETFPTRAGDAVLGCATPERLLIGLLGEIIARQADLLEEVGQAIDRLTSGLFDSGQRRQSDLLQTTLRDIGREGEVLARVRLSLLSLERALSYLTVALADRAEAMTLRSVRKTQQRDLQSLEVHGDFLSQRISMAVDTTMGMISLSQNDTVRILSVVAALFLPPTLIASIYGMNFATMPELTASWGYPVALGAMGLTALLSFIWMKWKKWV